MAIGERIRFFRNLRGMTQKYLGQVVGFPEKTADIRMAQYESGSRTPKAELTENLADALGVSPLALSVPDIDSYLGLMHTLFTLEDRYGLTIESGENGVSLRVDPRKGRDAAELSEMLTAWAQQAEKLRNGDISRVAILLPQRALMAKKPWYYWTFSRVKSFPLVAGTHDLTNFA